MGLGFRVQGLGFREQGFALRVPLYRPQIVGFPDNRNPS